MEIPTWFPLLYKNFGCAEPLLSWLQREEQGLSVQHLCEDARSWPIQQPRAPDTVPKAHTRNNNTQKKKKKKTRDSPRVVDSVRGCSWRRGVSVRAVWMGESGGSASGHRRAAYSLLLDFSAFCCGRFVTRPQSARCDSSNHNSWVRLAITRDELFILGFAG